MRHDWMLSFAVALLVTACGSASSSTSGHRDGGFNFGIDSGALTDGSRDSSMSLHSKDSGNGCPAAVTCSSAKVTCGIISNGCGGVVNCGGCPSGKTCGGGGTSGVCGTPSCTAKTCADQGFNCGPAGDGCGGSLSCGTCDDAETCGGGGTSSVCGSSSTCVPKTCTDLGFNCGPAGDGCGGSLTCGTCAGNQVCGGGGQPSVCGAPTCTPKTCMEVGANCGPTADGCGGLLECGTCAEPQTCGGGGTPSICGVPSSCTGLCLQQVSCPPADGGAPVTTTVSGVVYAPNGTDFLPNVLVYVPNGAAGAPTWGVTPFTPGVQCEQCSAGVSGSPLVTTTTDTFGRFTLSNVPVGANIPLVIQTGRWRRQTVIPSVASCVNTPLPTCTAASAASGACLTSLPQTHVQGDIPYMAFVTGSVDALECVMLKIGVAQSEFVLPPATFPPPAGSGRINLYVGDATGNKGGANLGGTTPSETTLVNTAANLQAYDMILFPCQGTEDSAAVTAAQQTNLITYAGLGGRVFATHFSYVWLFNDAPFSGTAAFDVNQAPDPADQTGYINMTFPRGLELAQWLLNIGAASTLGQIPITTLRHDVNSVTPPSQLWMEIGDPGIGGASVNDAGYVVGDAGVPMHYTFNTPVGVPAAQQCGRVLFDDFHVENVGNSHGQLFPAECPGGAMSAQEKLLEFMIFDLGSCVAPDVPTCTPETCMSQGFSCGPAGDGCGNVIQCGDCPAGETCGGGGMPSVCGIPTCTGKSCVQQGFSCGPAGDGCGNALNCGTCPAGEVCGGGGTPGVCGTGSCTPKTCTEQNLMCGPAGDGCGASLNCGTCPAGQTCGGGGTPGKCGSSCVSKTCVQLGFNCGAAGDGCGNQLNCGTCSAPQTCGGGGQPNVCGGSSPP